MTNICGSFLCSTSAKTIHKKKGSTALPKAQRANCVIPKEHKMTVLPQSITAFVQAFSQANKSKYHGES